MRRSNDIESDRVIRLGLRATPGPIYQKAKKAPRPFKIEHRALAPELIKECPEWAQWSVCGAYTTPANRDHALAELLRDSTGRWEYRPADDPAKKV